MQFTTNVVAIALPPGKDHVTLAVGCTGGQHRSVAVAEAIYAALSQDGWQVWLDHRDLPRYQR